MAAEHCTTKYRAHEFAIHTGSCYIKLSAGGEALRATKCDAVLLFLQFIHHHENGSSYLFVGVAELPVARPNIIWWLRFSCMIFTV